MEEKQSIVKPSIKRAIQKILNIVGVVFSFFILFVLIFFVVICLDFNDPISTILLLALFCGAFVVGFVIEYLRRKKARKSGETYHINIIRAILYSEAVFFILLLFITGMEFLADRIESAWHTYWQWEEIRIFLYFSVMLLFLTIFFTVYTIRRKKLCKNEEQTGNIQKNKTKRIVVFAVSSVAAVVLLCYSPQIFHAIKEKKRAHDFYKYIIVNIDSIYGGEGSDSLQIERIKAFERGYMNDSILVESYLDQLKHSSIAYRRSIKESSAYLVKQFNDTAPYEEVLRILKEEGYGIWPNIRLLYGIELKRKYGAQARKNIQRGELLIQDELEAQERQ